MAGPDVHHERLDPLAKLGGSWHDLREVVRRGIHPLSGHELILRTISLVAECLRSNASSARVLASYDGTRWEWFGAASIFRPEYECEYKCEYTDDEQGAKASRFAPWAEIPCTGDRRGRCHLCAVTWVFRPRLGNLCAERRRPADYSAHTISVLDARLAVASSLTRSVWLGSHRTSHGLVRSLIRRRFLPGTSNMDEPLGTPHDQLQSTLCSSLMSLT